MRFFHVFLCLLVGYSAVGQTFFSYKPSEELQSVESAAYYYVDSIKNLTFSQIRQLPDSVFQLNTRRFLNFGNTDYPVWLRIDLKNQSNEELYLLQQLHDVRMLDVYAFDTNNVLKSWFTGAMRPFGTNFLKRNQTVFDLGKSPKRVYMRVVNTAMYIPLKIGNIQAMATYFHHYDLFYGFICGILIALILYNLFVYWVVRDTLFLYYFLYIFFSSLIIFKADNHHHEFIFKQISNFSFDINFISTITIFFVLVFSNSYLRIRELAPKLFWLLAGLWSVGLLLLPSDWLPYRAWVSDVYQLLYMFFMLVLFVTSIYIYFLGFKPARFFILAFGFYTFGVVFILLGFLGITPMNTLLSAYTYHICSVLEALFFSFAVAHRFNTYRKEARDAKELVLKRAQEQEELWIKNNQLLTEKLQMEQEMNHIKLNEGLLTLLRQAPSANPLIKKISIPTVEGVIMFPEQDINRLEAMGSYCTIHLTDHKKITTSKPMSHFEQLVDSKQFMRIHKSHIINLNNVVRYIRGEGGWIEMKDKTELPVSRRLKNELLQRLSLTQPAV
ncbi:7TM diverse intracellular signaling domain-containing protein [Larkinella sp.]|uniref:7TM diverse intracellular signaling domain-containing protein n=1 Tax=Larkinella sp. TaxID=2034517 RepID=UPI003BAAFF21